MPVTFRVVLSHAKPRGRPTTVGASLLSALLVAACFAANADAQPAPGGQPEPTPRTTIAAPPEGVEPASHTADEPAPADEADRLHVSLAAYMWMTGFSGSTKVGGLTIDIDKSFLDIFDASDTIFGLMGAVDLEYNRLVFQFNGVYSRAEFSGRQTFAQTGGGGGGVDATVKADLEFSTAWLEVFGGLRFVDAPIGDPGESHPRLKLDGFVGVRYTSMSISSDVVSDVMVTLPNGRMLEAGERQSRDENKDWIEPFVGARLTIELTDHWSLALRGDVGGFGVDGSDFAWQAVALVGRRWRHDGWDISVFGGYRALGQDYSDGGFTWDVVTHGPLLGAAIVLAF